MIWLVSNMLNLLDFSVIRWLHSAKKSIDRCPFIDLIHTNAIAKELR